jgi:uncharacterized protein (UPF0276 family)
MGRNVDHVQNILKRRILIENPSSYFSLPLSTMSEGEFLARLIAQTRCGVLLDVNNVYVSAVNRGHEPRAALDDLLGCIAPSCFGEIHLAGHSQVVDGGGHCVRIDDHGSPVKEDVWSLYEETIRRIGPVPTLIEWDTDVPSLRELCVEAARAQLVLDRCAPAGQCYAYAC